MSNKIPCGGFYLDDMLNVNDSGELSIKGGTPYQQLVTDGEGNTQWEDRLAYITTEEQAIFSQEDIAFVEQNEMYFSSEDIIPATDINVGANYRVNFDGEAYDCVAYKLGADSGFYAVPGQGSDYIAIGNGFLYGSGEDTGEPFLIAYSLSRSRIVIATLLTNPTHTVSVTRAVETVHKIPEKFLSKGFIVNVVREETGSGGDTYLLLDKTDEEIKNALNNGSTVKLNSNGFSIQYDSKQGVFWGVFPNQVDSNGITELVVVSVKKSANGWLGKQTYITASTNPAS